MSKSVVGMIGLGIMGSAMSANLMKDGFTVVGYDVADDCVQAHVKRGGVGVTSIKELARAAEFIFTSLPSVAAFDAVTQGDDGLLAVTGATPIIIETSTLKIGDKQRGHDALQDAGMVMLDCPLSGTGAQARTKDLVVLASGDLASYERTVPVLEGMSRSNHYVGEFGNGSKMKFIANLLVAIHNASTAEALVLGMRAGLKPEDIFKVITDGAGNSRMFEIRGPMMVANDYDDATMKNSVWQKDMHIIAEFARSMDCPTPLFSSTEALYNAAMEQGLEAKDTASICAVMEAMAGLPERK
ncbi:MAG TPA: NAD(P)-dependent oxidoreductase [Rhodospirillales bacterium]|jgi:3-hydroxyisobutyrate dehydrogenase-like beta-hydroxyacid dehydrogenase|nr:MAG: oxidoreductase [Rhodospirillaceae bacterium]PPR72817.1 MAG: 2-(hydroxymethyl)glutarate dehydrogenase [Alphaproteobacteria bacterium MarineAlpha3_Bin2]HIM25247.1 NAD(P)-dependent oxidoreductase [Rhodospirillales bacterium]HIM76470.1 NAD(P)-dependent oxidoreductase [Rhodospirillales bacterium]